MQRFYDEANVRPSFTDVAMSTLSESMWYPTFDELLAANVITDQTLGGETTALYSFFKNRDEFTAAFLKEPTFEAIKKKHNAVFEEIIDAGWTKKLQGASDSHISQAMRDALGKNYKTILSSASNNVFEKYMNLVIEQARASRNLGYDACHLYTIGKLNIQQTLPPELWKREIDLINEALTDSDIQNKNFEPSQKIFEKIFQGMSAYYLEAIKNPQNGNKIDVCNASIAMYDNINKLPYEEMISVAKYIFLSE
jgi:hypothetical protein